MTDYSPFLALPTELRLHIYSHVFCLPPEIDLTQANRQIEAGSASDSSDPRKEPGEEDPADGTVALKADTKPNGPRKRVQEYPAGEIKITISGTVTSCREDRYARSVGRRFTAILRTCRQIHAEAVDILYQQTLFRIALGGNGLECVDESGRLCMPPRKNATYQEAEVEGMPLLGPSLFTKMQNIQLDLNFGLQPSPIWDALPVIHALLSTLRTNTNRKYLTASLRFGLMTAVTCGRLSEEVWQRWVSEVQSIDFGGCAPDVEVDSDVERWTAYGRGRFEELAGAVGGELRFVRFEETLGAHDHGLRGCTIL